VYPRYFAVFGSRPFKSHMTCHAIIVIAQILGDYRYAQAQQGEDSESENRKWQDSPAILLFELSASACVSIQWASFLCSQFAVIDKTDGLDSCTRVSAFLQMSRIKLTVPKILLIPVT